MTTIDMDPSRSDPPSTRAGVNSANYGVAEGKREATPWERAAVRLGEAVDAAHAILTEVEARLSPLLRDSLVANSLKDPAPVESCSLVVAHLAEMTERVEDLVRQSHSILARLDV